MCISGIVTTVIVALGVVLLVPLQPVLTSPVVATATRYVMPALFGSMATSFFLNKNAGAYVIQGKMKLSLTILVLMMALFLIFPALIPQQGYVLMFSDPGGHSDCPRLLSKGHRNSDRAVRGSGTEATDQNEAARGEAALWG